MSAKFGPGGSCEAFKAAGGRSTLQAPGYIRKRGLDAYEYEAGNGLSASEALLAALGLKAKEHNISVSFHTPYFISLSSVEREKRIKSVEYIRQSAYASKLLDANIMVVHCGSCAKISRETAMEYAAETLTDAAQMLEDNGFKPLLGIETMGKVNQLGTLDEVLTLCKISDKFAPVVDFGHLNAREQGWFKSLEDFERVFDTIENELGADSLRVFHSHFSKIEYTTGGEKKHLTFEDKVYGPDFEPVMEIVARKNCSPIFVCESDGTQAEDAKAMKDHYLSLI